MKKSDITKQKILEAAEEEFSESGLYGARVDSISERAGVNKRMIYAYFVNKEQLYITVLTGVYNRMALEEKKLLGCRLSCEDMIRRIIAMYFDFLYHNPTFVRMLMWENLNNAGYIKSSEAGIVKGYSLKMLSDTIARGIYEGVFRPDIDLESIVISINMEDLERYFAAHPLPRAAFTPDSDYAVCNREKGILQVEFSSPKIARLAISGGDAVNAVVGKASASLPNNYELASRLRRMAPSSPCGISVMETCGEINVLSSGTAAHAMEPQKGNNAATALLQLLKNAMGTTGSPVCDFVADQIGREFDGASLGVKCEDEPSGALTLNVGYLKTDKEKIRIGCDIRYPVTKSGEELIAILRDRAAAAGVEFRVLHHTEPLYLPPESKLVQLLCGAFEDVTGKKAVIYSTGGGTYARALQGRGVAFGAEFPGGRSGGMHTAGEHCDPEELKLHAVICMEAMYRMMVQE